AGVRRHRRASERSAVLKGTAAIQVSITIAALRAKADVADAFQESVLLLEIRALRSKQRFQIRFRFPLLRPSLKFHEIGNRNSRQDADDRHHDNQLDEGKSAPFPHWFCHRPSP